MIWVLAYLVLGIIVIETVVPFWGPEKLIAVVVWPLVLGVTIWMEIREARRPRLEDSIHTFMLLAAAIVAAETAKNIEQQKKNQDWKWN